MNTIHIEINSTALNAAEEDDLISKLENISSEYCYLEWWSEFYHGEFKIDTENVVEDDDLELWGKIILDGEVDDTVLELIYDVVENTDNITYSDNDPFHLKSEQMAMDLIKATVEGKIPYSREIAKMMYDKYGY